MLKLISNSMRYLFVVTFVGEDDEEVYGEFGSASKKKRPARTVKIRKAASNKYG